MTITTPMLPAKLQLIYDFINNESTLNNNNNNNNNHSELTYDQFKKYLSQLQLLPNISNTNNLNVAIPNSNNHNSEFLHHIFSTYKQTSSQNNNNNKGQYWLSILSKANNGSAINSEKFIQVITNCKMESMTESPVRRVKYNSFFFFFLDKHREIS